VVGAVACTVALVARAYATVAYSCVIAVEAMISTGETVAPCVVKAWFYNTKGRNRANGAKRPIGAIYCHDGIEKVFCKRKTSERWAHSG